MRPRMFGGRAARVSSVTSNQSRLLTLPLGNHSYLEIYFSIWQLNTYTTSKLNTKFRFFSLSFFLYERFPLFFLSALVSILTIIRWTHNVNANGTSIIALLFWAQFMFGNIMTISHFHLFFQTERGPALEIW